jgi:two-component system alkaline phosphatase synthesis response regulator PhoP
MKQKHRILIVDDNHSLVLATERVLQKDGFDVLTAYDGLEGLEKARAEKPDLIILDIMMPKMDGYEVCHQLRSDPATAQIPIIILSAKGEVDTKKSAPILGLKEVYTAYDLGANNFLTKPVTANDILDAVRDEFSFSALLNSE